jgi:hypothetical protein
MKVDEKEQQLEQDQQIRKVLEQLGFLPDGYTFSVRLHGESRDKKRTSSFERSWKPETDSIYIRFEALPKEQPASPLPAARPIESTSAGVGHFTAASGPLSDLIRALDRAESRPGYNFVALKWFRDTALLSEGFSWAVVDSERKNILNDAISRRLILTNKVANPKSPEFPVTAIRLNRLMPEVKQILGVEGENVPDFRPIPIRGESLSATILRDRR